MHFKNPRLEWETLPHGWGGESYGSSTLITQMSAGEGGKATIIFSPVQGSLRELLNIFGEATPPPERFSSFLSDLCNRQESLPHWTCKHLGSCTTSKITGGKAGREGRQGMVTTSGRQRSMPFAISIKELLNHSEQRRDGRKWGKGFVIANGRQTVKQK